MVKFKVGDRVVTSGDGRKVYGHVKEGTVYKVCRVDKHGHIWVDIPGFFDTCFNEYWLEFAEPENNIQLNHQYTSKNGQKWECIAIKGGIAFLSSGGDGDAYRFLLNGENLSQGGGLWDIQWEPVVEWVDTKISWAKKGEMQPNHYHYSIRFPLIDGKPDFTQATVTPL